MTVYFCTRFISKRREKAPDDSTNEFVFCETLFKPYVLKV